jgi:1-acyl-sn-glycerol-3-phosphate acyltransferase
VSVPAPGPRPSELLYDAVALGMGLYVASAFRVEVLDAEPPFRTRRGHLLVATHRADSDVPLLCAALYVRGRLWRRSRPRIHFAARDDLFSRGFLAGFVPGLPPALRRLLYPVSLAPVLRRLRVHPARTARALTLGRLLEMVPPQTRLETLLPVEPAEGLRRRAASRCRPAPSTAEDALSGDFADLLLTVVTPRDVPDDAAPGVWRSATAQAVTAAREIVEVLAAGEPLLLFPEGRTSADGAIGPLDRALDGLLRRGRPEAIIPLGIAYDRLVDGRPRVCLAIGAPFPPPTADAGPAVLRELKRAMPVTCGQVVASRVMAASRDRAASLDQDALERALRATVAEARAQGRPVERALCGPAWEGRLSECLGALARMGAIGGTGRDLVLHPERVLASGVIARLAREHASAWQLVDG